MHPFIISLLLPFFIAFQGDGDISIVKVEAKSAYNHLNEVRANPDKYSDALGYGRNLEVTGRALIWNDTLASIAEKKAYDMANRHYFGHVDPDGYGMNYYISQSGYTLEKQWTADPKANSFESIHMSGRSISLGDESGVDAINDLIVDEGVPSLGHRKHLLGIEPWNAALVDIGIGIARVDSGDIRKTYVSVVIARHHW